jgi:hypothetical protein
MSITNAPAYVFPTSAQNPPATVTATVVQNTAGAVVLDSGTGSFPFSDASVVALTITADPAGLCTIQPAATCTGMTLKGATPSSGAGKPLTLSGTDGASGAQGGALNVRGGKSGTPGAASSAGLSGPINIDTGAANASGAHGKIVFRQGNPDSSPTEFLSFQRTSSYSAGIFSATGFFGIKVQPILDVGSTDDSVYTRWNQNDASITHVCAYMENGGQYSSAINKIAVASTVNINWNLSNTVWVGATSSTKITTNVTVAAPTNPREGNILYGVRAVSNGTNTFTWNAVFTFPASGTGINQWAAGVPTDGKILWHWFAWNGTNYECVASSVI